MPKAERIEDLGRIREKLSHALDDDFFEWAKGLKYSEEEIDPDRVRLKVSYLEDKFYECLEIARGENEDVF